MIPILYTNIDKSQVYVIQQNITFPAITDKSPITLIFTNYMLLVKRKEPKQYCKVDQNRHFCNHIVPPKHSWLLNKEHCFIKENTKKQSSTAKKVLFSINKNPEASMPNYVGLYAILPPLRIHHGPSKVDISFMHLTTLLSLVTPVPLCINVVIIWCRFVDNHPNTCMSAPINPYVAPICFNYGVFQSGGGRNGQKQPV